MFVELVTAERPLELEAVRRLADGRLFTGRQALELGLADEIGDLDAAVEYAAGLAGLAGDPRVIRVRQRPVTWWSLVDQIGAVMSRGRTRHVRPRYVLR